MSLGDTFFCGKIFIILSETIYQTTELLQLHNQRQVILHTHKTPSNETSKPEVIYPAKKLRWLIDCLKPETREIKNRLYFLACLVETDLFQDIIFQLRFPCFFLFAIRHKSQFQKLIVKLFPYCRCVKVW